MYVEGGYIKGVVWGGPRAVVHSDYDRSGADVQRRDELREYPNRCTPRNPPRDTRQYVLHEGGEVERPVQREDMSDETREHAIRVNDTDAQMLKSAKAQFEADVPLGYVARVGARKIIEDSDDSNEVTIA